MQRLKTRDQYQDVLAGKIVARTVHFAMHSLSAELLGAGAPVMSMAQQASEVLDKRPIWIGALVPKRWARRAVTRNLIKRQIYCVAGQFEAILPAAAHIVRLRCAFDRQRYKSAASNRLKEDVRSEIEHLFSQAIAASIKAAA